MTMQVSSDQGVTAKYVPSRPSMFPGETLPASINISLSGASFAQVGLSIEDARVLAERLPALIMAHDVAERIVKEQAAAIAEAA
ncbi:hypothetical protein ACIO14_27525 [Nocardia fluminea]|uniref:hypothetical protein n=1 Tax=Nocardia fluminea TaxID=134984 RepID=UPI00381A8DB3